MILSFRYFGVGFGGAAIIIAGMASGAAGLPLSSDFTESGILSEFASNTLTCQICVSVKRPLNPGIPVNRMPFSAFQ